MRWADHIARMEEGRSTFKILADKPTRSKPLGRPRHTWEDNIRTDIWAKEGQEWEWKKLHNEKVHSLYRLPDIVRVIKSKRVRWTGHIARMEEGKSSFKTSKDKPT